MATMLHNKIVSDADTATRLFETLEHDQTGVQAVVIGVIHVCMYSI